MIDPAPTEVYQTERNGKFSYTISRPQASGQHITCSACISAKTIADRPRPSMRVFSVFANGKEILHDFDIFKDAGGQHTAVIRESTFTAPDDGKLAITFTIKTNGAIIQAIEVIPK